MKNHQETNIDEDGNSSSLNNDSDAGNESGSDDRLVKSLRKFPIPKGSRLLRRIISKEKRESEHIEKLDFLNISSSILRQTLLTNNLLLKGTHNSSCKRKFSDIYKENSYHYNNVDINSSTIANLSSDYDVHQWWLHHFGLQNHVIDHLTSSHSNTNLNVLDVTWPNGFLYSPSQVAYPSVCNLTGPYSPLYPFYNISRFPSLYQYPKASLPVNDKGNHIRVSKPVFENGSLNWVEQEQQHCQLPTMNKTFHYNLNETINSNSMSHMIYKEYFRAVPCVLTDLIKKTMNAVIESRSDCIDTSLYMHIHSQTRARSSDHSNSNSSSSNNDVTATVTIPKKNVFEDMASKLIISMPITSSTSTSTSSQIDNNESNPNIAVNSNNSNSSNNNSSNNDNNTNNAKVEEEVLEIKKGLLVNTLGRHMEGVADALIDKMFACFGPLGVALRVNDQNSPCKISQRTHISQDCHRTNNNNNNNNNNNHENSNVIFRGRRSDYRANLRDEQADRAAASFTTVEKSLFQDPHIDESIMSDSKQFNWEHILAMAEHLAVTEISIQNSTSVTDIDKNSIDVEIKSNSSCYQESDDLQLPSFRLTSDILQRTQLRLLSIFNQANITSLERETPYQQLIRQRLVNYHLWMILQSSVEVKVTYALINYLEADSQ